ncbi:hypothetical protein GGR57DRAFT_147698 [Xylariaceae sp. FL1272]|nr:hypothetical protein GGR57DRAFT_147698 [Xylariaceae sp. FL1272]
MNQQDRAQETTIRDSNSVAANLTTIIIPSCCNDTLICLPTALQLSTASSSNNYLMWRSRRMARKPALPSTTSFATRNRQMTEFSILSASSRPAVTSLDRPRNSTKRFDVTPSVFINAALDTHDTTCTDKQTTRSCFWLYTILIFVIIGSYLAPPPFSFSRRYELLLL